MRHEALFCLQRAALPSQAGWTVLILLLILCLGVVSLVELVAKRAAHLERLPIADRDIFRAAWRDLMLMALGTLPGFWLFFHWFTRTGGGSEHGLHAAAALLLTGTLIATGCIAAVWLRAIVWAKWVMNSAWFVMIIGMQTAGDKGHPLVRDAVDQLATCLRLATPPGWVVTWFMERPHGEAQAALWLVPVALVFPLGWHAWQRLRDSYAVSESTPSLPQVTPAQAIAIMAVANQKGFTTPHLHGPTAIEDSLKAREFLQERPGLDSGWLDRLILRLLSGRERLLLDFMVLMPLKWTWWWKFGLVVGAGGLVIGELLRPVRPDLFWLASGLGGVGLLFTTLPLANGLSRAFTLCPVAGGSPLPLVGCLPISYAEVLWLDLKISAVRALTALPAALAFGVVMAWQLRVEAGPLIGAVMAFKVILCVMALRPFMIAAQYSAGTNDSQLSRLRGWVMMAFAIAIGLSLVAFGAGALVASAWWSWLCLVAFALVSWSFYAVHRRCYDRMVFDLQPSTLLGQHPVG